MQSEPATEHEMAAGCVAAIGELIREASGVTYDMGRMQDLLQDLMQDLTKHSKAMLDSGGDVEL